MRYTRVQIHKLLMLRTIFFRTLAVLAFFCSYVFRFFIPLGLMGIGLGFASLLLDSGQSGDIPSLSALHFPPWGEAYLQWFPFASVKGALLFSVLVSLFEYLSVKLPALEKHPYLSRSSFAIVLYGFICFPYLANVYALFPDQLPGWIGIVLIGIILIIMISVWEVKKLSMIRIAPTAFHRLGKFFWQVK